MTLPNPRRAPILLPPLDCAGELTLARQLAEQVQAKAG